MTRRHENGCRCAIGYCRVSTTEQAQQGVSLKAQRSRIKAYCQSHDLDLSSIHADEGISGRRQGNRPALNEALREVCDSNGTLICYSLSRLARSTRDALDISQRIQRAGAKLVLLTERVDTRSPAGKLFFVLLAALAEFESQVIGERTRMALAYKRERGERWSGQPPFGFAFKKGKLHPKKSEQEIIRRIRRLRRQGLTYRAIADRLNEDGIRNRNGKPFAFQSIAVVLKRVEQ